MGRPLTVEELEFVSGGEVEGDHPRDCGIPGHYHYGTVGIGFMSNHMFMTSYSNTSEETSDNSEIETDRNSEHEGCQTITMPDGTQFWIPDGYTLVNGGVGPDAGYHYMQGPDGTVYQTPNQIIDAVNDFAAVQGSASDIGYGSGSVSTATGALGWIGAAGWSAFIAAVSGVFSLIDLPTPSVPPEDCSNGGH